MLRWPRNFQQSFKPARDFMRTDFLHGRICKKRAPDNRHRSALRHFRSIAGKRRQNAHTLRSTSPIRFFHPGYRNLRPSCMQMIICLNAGPPPLMIYPHRVILIIQRALSSFSDKIRIFVRIFSQNKKPPLFTEAARILLHCFLACQCVQRLLLGHARLYRGAVQHA